MSLPPVQRVDRLHFVAAALERTDRDQPFVLEESLPRAFPPSRGSSCRGCSSSRRYSRSGKLRSACSRSGRAPGRRRRDRVPSFPRCRSRSPGGRGQTCRRRPSLRRSPAASRPSFRDPGWGFGRASRRRGVEVRRQLLFPIDTEVGPCVIAKECLARLQQHRRVHQAPATDAYAAHDADVPEEVLHEKPAKADLRNPKQLA